MSTADDYEGASRIEEDDSKLVPNAAFTPDPGRSAYNVNCNDHDPIQEIADQGQDYMSILKVNLEDHA